MKRIPYGPPFEPHLKAIVFDAREKEVIENLAGFYKQLVAGTYPYEVFDFYLRHELIKSGLEELTNPAEEKFLTNDQITQLERLFDTPRWTSNPTMCNNAWISFFQELKTVRYGE